MNPACAKQFLTRYETAATRLEKTLALYNAVAVTVPFDEVRAFLGPEADGFLSVIQTLKNEDADISTAFAHEEDAPSEEYLAALYEQLKARCDAIQED